VIPGVIKGAIGWGARFGLGAISCRSGNGTWSRPSFLRLTGGSFGFQIGGEKSDIVLFFMTERGARSMLESKFTLGGNASIAAGPAGRSGEASTDIKLGAEIYSYAKSRGLFAGLSLEGARLAPDEKANARYYGTGVTAKTLLFEHESTKVPASAEGFRKALP
jgi:lipid-binding SYLF domain-containing protein